MKRQALAQRIRFFRKKRGLTQVEFANESGIEYRHLQKLEAGDVDVKLSTVARLATQFDVPACYLLESTQNEQAMKLELPCPITVLEALPMAVHVFDLEGTLHYVNQEFLSMTGYSKAELIGKTRVFELMAPEGRDNSAQFQVESTIRGQPEPKLHKTRIIKSDGTRLEVFFKWRYLRSSKGELKAVIVTSTPLASELNFY